MIVWTPTMITAALETMALRRAGEFRHRLGQWTAGKRKLGKGVRKAVCMMCGKQALLAPYGFAKVKNRMTRETPGIRGDAIFEPCVNSDLPLELESDHGLMETR